MTLLRADQSGLIRAFCAPMNIPALSWIGDHTFILSDSGDVWCCKGQTESGRQIVSANVNLRLASRLAGADGFAGIRYLRTGVCHQIANRILFPSGQTVHAARGYNKTMSFYGVYGDFLPGELGEINIYLQLIKEAKPATDSDVHRGGFSEAPSPPFEYREHAVIALDNGKGLSDELVASVEQRLSRRLEKQVQDDLIRENEHFNDEHRKLLQRLDMSAISNEQYDTEFQNIWRKKFDRFAKILGQEDFNKAFDE